VIKDEKDNKKFTVKKGGESSRQCHRNFGKWV